MVAEGTSDESQPADASLDALTEAVTNALQEAGYRAKSPRPGRIATASSGMNFTLSFDDATSCQFRCGVIMNMPLEAVPNWLERANRFNRDYRFGKVFLDSDNDLVMTVDLNFSGSGTDLTMGLDQAMTLFDGCLGLFKTLLQSDEPNSEHGTSGSK